MFGPFKSSAQREREAIRDVVIEAILKSEASARSEIICWSRPSSPRPGGKR